MIVERVSAEEYKKLVPDRKVFFNEPSFCELNKDKVAQVHYLIIMKEKSARFGVILGENNGEMLCPFSAPYSYPVTIREHAKVSEYDEALTALEEYSVNIGIDKLRFILPPLCYAEHELSAWVSAFYRKGYGMSNTDLSYAIDLQRYNVDSEQFCKKLPLQGRSILRKSLRMNLTVQRCESEEEYKEAYEIIKINHETKGFPVRMSFSQLMDTLRIVDHDVFIVRADGVGILSEFLYKVSRGIAQVIYCGVHPEYTKYGSMNFLNYYTVRLYGNMGYQMLDWGPATENSVPNYGLCDFKESGGFSRSLKFSFEKRFD